MGNVEPLGNAHPSRPVPFCKKPVHTQWVRAKHRSPLGAGGLSRGQCLHARAGAASAGDPSAAPTSRCRSRDAQRRAVWQLSAPGVSVGTVPLPGAHPRRLHGSAGAGHVSLWPLANFNVFDGESRVAAATRLASPAACHRRLVSNSSVYNLPTLSYQAAPLVQQIFPSSRQAALTHLPARLGRLWQHRGPGSGSRSILGTGWDAEGTSRGGEVQRQSGAVSPRGDWPWQVLLLEHEDLRLEEAARSGDAPSRAALRGGTCFVLPAKSGRCLVFAELQVLTLHYMFPWVFRDSWKSCRLAQGVF